MADEATPSSGHLGPRVQDALQDLQSYLSDEIPPLFFVDSLQQLFEAPPQIVAAQIASWSTSQYSATDTLPTSDYLFHAAKKIHLICELELFPEQAIKEFLARLEPELLAVCPEVDRAGLKQDLKRLDLAVGVQSAPGVEVVYRRSGSESKGRSERPRTAGADTAAGSGAETSVSSSFVGGLKKLDFLLDNLQRRAATMTGEGKQPAADTFKRLSGEVVTQAATWVDSGEEMERLLQELGRRGLPVSTDQILALLAARLPDWAPQNPGGEVQEGSPQAAVRAMGHVVTMARDQGERQTRYSELVETAVTEFNDGSLGRSVTMLELATSMAEQNEIDSYFADSVRRQAFSRLEMKQLQTMAEDKENRLLLRRFLNFFPSLGPDELLAKLDGEPDRHQRKFLLDLLRVHGPAARDIAFSELVEAQAGSKFFHWHFMRNQVHLLRTIPRSSTTPIENEIDVLIPLTSLDNELPLIREALATFSQLSHERSVTTLAARVNEVEQILLGDQPHAIGPDQLISLLDTMIRILANIPTQMARRVIVVHGLKRNSRLGNTLKRLVWLSDQDLSDDRDVVNRLVGDIRNELPRGLLGFKRKSEKKQQALESLVRALAGTRSRDVSELLVEIKDKHADLPIGSLAAEILADGEASTAPAEEAEPTLLGDLSLFGLPNLLQNLADSQIDGLLKVLGSGGGTTARIWMEGGRLIAADAGKLKGEVAVYQLLEDPSPGQFVFGDSHEEPDSEARSDQPMSVQSVLFEGVRRYDEFNRAAAVVPDEAVFEPTGAKPTSPEGETDGELVRQVWLRASSGFPCVDCEEEVAVDRFRIRCLYEHWLTEGSLGLMETATG
jgi:hypothetical protein